MDSPASICLLGKVYPLHSFHGIECISRPTRFSLQFYIDESLVLDDLLDVKLTIHLGFNTPHKRHINAHITHIEKEAIDERIYRYYLETVHPIAALYTMHSQHYILNSSYLDACHKILKNAMLLEQTRFVNIDYTPVEKNTIAQSSNENDGDFLTRLLSRNGLYYQLSDKGHINIYSYSIKETCHHRQSFFYESNKRGLTADALYRVFQREVRQVNLNTSIKLKAVDGKDHNEVITQHIGDRLNAHSIFDYDIDNEQELKERLIQRHLQYEDKKYHYQFYTNCSDVAVARIIDIVDEDNNRCAYFVSKIKYKFDNNKMDDIRVKLTLTPLNKKFRAEKLQQLPKENFYQATTHMVSNGIASIDAPYVYSLPGHHKGGPNYRQTSFRLNPSNSAYGLNFPMHDDNQVLIGHLTNSLTKSMLLTTINPTYDYDNTSPSVLVKTKDNYFLNLNGENRLGKISFGCAQSQFLLTESTINRHLKLKTHGNININAKKNIYETHQNVREMTYKDKFIYLDGDYKIDTHSGGLVYANEKSLTMNAKEIRMNVRQKQNIDCVKGIFSAKSLLTLNCEDGEILHQCDNGRVIIKSESIAISAESHFEIGNDNGFLRLDAKTCYLQASQLVLKSKRPISYQGQVDFISDTRRSKFSFQPRKMRVSNPLLLNTSTIPNISFLSWRGSIANVEKGNHACFVVSGFSGRERGQVIVYRCHPKARPPLLTEPLLNASSDESYQRFDSIDFQLDDVEIYQNKDEFKSPLTVAHLAVLWQPKEIKASNVGSAAYYRFRVVIAGLNLQNYSSAMRLYKRVDMVIDSTLKATSARLCRDRRTLIDSLSETEVKAVKNNHVTFENIILGAKHRIYFYHDEKAIEVINEEGTKLTPYYEFVAKDDMVNERHSIYLMSPPIIVDFSDLDNECEQPPLTEEVFDYFKDSNNSMTLFVHGFNIDKGEFLHYKKSNGDCYWHEDVDITVKTLGSKETNGKGALSWLLAMEDNLNHAAKGLINYRQFQRIAMVVWHGKPKYVFDYYKAVDWSKEVGKRLSALIETIRQKCKTMQINIIAHSQGGGVLLSALDAIASRDIPITIDNAVLWQAALPANALSCSVAHRGADIHNPYYRDVLKKIKECTPWYLPLAYRGAERFHIIYSRRDNILGPLISGDENRHEVLNSKPSFELLAATFATCLGFQSLYQAAMWIGAPVSYLLTDSGLEKTWQSFYLYKSNLLSDTTRLMPTIEEQVLLCRNNGVLKAITKDIANRIHRHKSVIQSIIKTVDSVSDSDYLSWIYYILRHIDFIEYIIIERQREKEHFRSDHQLLAAFLERYQGTLATGIQVIYQNIIQQHLKLITKIAVFVRTLFIDKHFSLQPSMGWFGVDVKTQAKLGKRLISIDTTDLIFHHSVIKSPSAEVLKRVYRAHLLNHETGLRFGK